MVDDLTDKTNNNNMEPCPDDTELTLLKYAASFAPSYYDGGKKFDIEVFNSIISHTSDINAVDASGSTAMHHAVQGNEELALELINKGADLLKRDGDGNTIIHLCMFHTLLYGLIDRGLSCFSLNNDGETPLVFIDWKLSIVRKDLSHLYHVRSSDYMCRESWVAEDQADSLRWIKEILEVNTILSEEHIMEIKELLHTRGFVKDISNGIELTAHEVEAVRAYQKHSGMQEDGHCSAELRQRLIENKKTDTLRT